MKTPCANYLVIQFCVSFENIVMLRKGKNLFKNVQMRSLFFSFNDSIVNKA